MEHNPLRGLFGVSSPRPVEQRVAPQPTEPTENENENAFFEVWAIAIRSHVEGRSCV